MFPPRPGGRSLPVRGPARASGRSARVLLLCALVGLLLAGCATAPVDRETGVHVQLSNPTSMRVWVVIERSRGGAHWVRPVRPGSERDYWVRHGAFGHGPVRLLLVRWPGARHLTTVYESARSLRVPPGSALEVRLRPRLSESSVSLRRRPAPESTVRPDPAPGVVRFGPESGPAPVAGSRGGPCADGACPE